MRGATPSETVTEEDLRRRFRALKEPESPCNLSHAQLAERFKNIFGDSGVVGNSESRGPIRPSSPLDIAVEAYLEAAQEGGDGLDGAVQEWNEIDMVYQNFIGGVVTPGDSEPGHDDAVSQLLEQAQDSLALGISNTFLDMDSDGNEDAEVAHIIEASREEAALELKYGADNDTDRPANTNPKVKKGKKKKKKKKYKNKKKGRGKAKNKKRRLRDSSSDSCSSSDCVSSDISSDSSSTSSDASDSDGGRTSVLPYSSAASHSVLREEEFRREEADTYRRLKNAVREEGKDSELVRILAKRLISLRKSRNIWARQHALQMPKAMQRR